MFERYVFMRMSRWLCAYTPMIMFRSDREGVFVPWFGATTCAWRAPGSDQCHLALQEFCSFGLWRSVDERLGCQDWEAGADI